MYAWIAEGEAKRIISVVIKNFVMPKRKVIKDTKHNPLCHEIFVHRKQNF